MTKTQFFDLCRTRVLPPRGAPLVVYNDMHNVWLHGTFVSWMEPGWYDWGTRLYTPMDIDSDAIFYHTAKYQRWLGEFPSAGSVGDLEETMAFYHIARLRWFDGINLTVSMPIPSVRLFVEWTPESKISAVMWHLGMWNLAGPRAAPEDGGYGKCSSIEEGKFRCEAAYLSQLIAATAVPPRDAKLREAEARTLDIGGET